MADIKPFAGISYNQSKVRLEDVVTPPYDVITPEQQESFYKKSDYNFVRLDLNKIKPSDDGANNRYTRAKKYLEQWLKEGILIKSEKPGLYFYEQIFKANNTKYNRKGLIALVRVQDFDKGEILPHERTLPKAQEDRFNLLKATEANLSSIFGLYADKTGTVDRIIENCSKAKEAEVEFEGVLNRLSVINDAADIEAIQKAIKDNVIYIADGHHRYKVSLQYRDYMRTLNRDAGPDASWEFTMMDLVNAYSEGMVILPTHRLVKVALSSDDIIRRLSSRFEITDYSTVDEQISALNKNDGKKVLGLYTGGKNLLLTLKDDSLLSDIPSAGIEVIKNLDVTLLHEVALFKCLGADINAPEKGLVKFTVDPRDAVYKVDSKEFDAAFFLNPTKMEQVQAVAEQRQIMPQKSTYFYPKLLTGLVIRKM